MNIQKMESLLRDKGIPSAEAAQLAREVPLTSAGFLEAVGRHRSKGAPTLPAGSDPLLMFAIGALGRWDDSREGDWLFLESVTGIKKDQLLAALTKLAQPPNNILDRRAHQWRVLDRTAIWIAASKIAPNGFFEKYGEGVQLALLWNQKRFEVEKGKRFQAQFILGSDEFSNLAREGIAEGLAILGNALKDKATGHWSGDTYATVIAKTIFDQIQGWKDWASLGRQLQFLAESAPLSFIECVESRLSANPREFSELFEAEEDMGDAPHVGLMWALQVLAWSPKYVARVAVILAKLHLLETGGRTYPRSLDTLTKIFLPWLPQTTIPSKARIEVLKQLNEKVPTVAIDLLYTLLPEPAGGTTSGTAVPQWFMKLPDERQRPEDKEIVEEYQNIGGLLLEMTKANPSLVSRLVDRLNRFVPPLDEAALSLLETLTGSITGTDRLEAWKCLRNEISEHRTYPTASWAMDEKRLQKLEAIMKTLEPQDSVDLALPLFSNRPTLVSGLPGENFEEQDRLISAAQDEAIKKLNPASNTEHLRALIERAEDTGKVGLSLARSVPEAALLPILDTIGLDATPRHLALLRGAIWHLHLNGGIIRMLNDVFPNVKSFSTPDVGATLLAELRSNPEAWKAISTKGEEFENKYWQAMEWARLEDTEKDGEAVIREMIRHGQGGKAIHFICIFKKKSLVSRDPDLMFEALEQACAEVIANPRSRDISHSAEELIGILQKEPGANREKLIHTELSWYPMLGRWSKLRPVTLIEELSKNPENFIHLVKLAFPKEKASTEEEQRRAKNASRIAHELLDAWRDIPGRSPDGINEKFLEEWVLKARELAEADDILEICDVFIGHLLAHAPIDADGTWPAKPIRQLVEKLESQQIDSGISTELYNSKGVYTKALDDGGMAEGSEASKYANMAESLEALATSPRLAAILRKLESSWASNARSQALDLE